LLSKTKPSKVSHIETKRSNQKEVKMTRSQLKAKLEEAIKNDDKAAILEIFGPVLDKLASMIQCGTLIRNVKAHLSNNGITGKACDMITEIAIIRAESFMHYKAKR